MKLTYRGVQYNYTPPEVSTKRTSDVGKYRGVDIRFRTVAKRTVHQPTLDLIYRGAAYRIGEAATQAVSTASPANAAIANSPEGGTPTMLTNLDLKARTMLVGHNRNVKRRQQAMLTRLAADVGLDADVTAYWNRIQGKVHPSFWATYDRGHAAAS